jgi:hypothetical protein
MAQMSFGRSRGNVKTLSAALGVGVLLTMGAATLAHPIGAAGTSSDSWQADTTMTLAPSPTGDKVPTVKASPCDNNRGHHCGFHDPRIPTLLVLA